MTVWELIHELSRYDPHTPVAICPMQRERWKRDREQPVTMVHHPQHLTDRRAKCDSSLVVVYGSFERKP